MKRERATGGTTPVLLYRGEDMSYRWIIQSRRESKGEERSWVLMYVWLKVRSSALSVLEALLLPIYSCAKGNNRSRISSIDELSSPPSSGSTFHAFHVVKLSRHISPLRPARNIILGLDR